MSYLRRMCFLFFLLNKRIMKKYSFLAVLCMVPLLAAGMSWAAKGDTGILHIVLCQEDTEDALSGQVIGELMGPKSVLRYSQEQSVEAACEAVGNGKADAAWIFSDRFQEDADAYAAHPGQREPLVTVVEREDTVFLQLARERLYSVLYPHLSYALFQSYVVSELAGGEEISQDELLAEYQVMEVDGNIFQFSRRAPVAKENETGYFLAPLRGLLALLVLLCGLTVSLYFLQDRGDKIFARMPGTGGVFFPYLYHMTAVFDGAVAVLAAFCVAGIAMPMGREIFLMAIYCVSCVGFCSLLGKLCRNAQRLSACIPILALGMIILCPVFITINRFRALQYLFPLFYYLQSVYNDRYVKYFLFYTLALYGADLLATLISKKISRVGA